MPWTERQHRLLGAMGLRLFGPPVGAGAAAGTAASAADAADVFDVADLAARSATDDADDPAGDGGGSLGAVRGSGGAVRAAESSAASAAPASEAGPAGGRRPGPAAAAPARSAEPGALPARVSTPPEAASMTVAAPRPLQPPMPPAAAPSDDGAWAALRQTVDDCRDCGLGTLRRRPVFGSGHPRAHWLIVGEAPGEAEEASGEPFEGAAGRLLDAMLRALGLTRAPAEPSQQVFVTHLLKCRPPAHRNPLPAELAACETLLRRQASLLEPKVVLALGRVAAQALLRSEAPVGRLRGRVHAWHGMPLVVSHAPAYLLRHPADKAEAWGDWCLAAAAVAASVATAAAPPVGAG